MFKKISTGLFLYLVCASNYALNELQDEAFYCPLRIDYINNQWQISECDKTGHCYAEYHGILAKYFNQPNIKLTNNHTYLLDSASSTFHSSSTNSSCNYSETPFRKNVIILKIKPEANLEANIDGSTSWILPNVICNEDTSQDDWYLKPHLGCPLKNRLGFVIHNINVTSGVILQSNEINITQNIPSTQYTAVTDEDALYGCGNSQQCSIDIQSTKGLKYGSIEINLETMKVLNIIELLPSKVQIKKIEPFNSIEVSYPN